MRDLKVTGSNIFGECSDRVVCGRSGAMLRKSLIWQGPIAKFVPNYLAFERVYDSIRDPGLDTFTTNSSYDLRGLLGVRAAQSNRNELLTQPTDTWPKYFS